jgi:hypothetical protein
MSRKIILILKVIPVERFRQTEVTFSCGCIEKSVDKRLCEMYLT